MFYSLINPILGYFMKLTILTKFKMADPRWRIQDGGYFYVKYVIVTSLLLLMLTYPLSGTRILSDSLLLRLCGYTSSSKKILIK